MTESDRLKTYREKRDFTRTPEPPGGDLLPTPDRPRFVIQKHAASRLHYDFRIEVDGVLKSWAVPKGPSTDPGIKRLAVPTEDHPLDYLTFEGVIPEGSYGAGTMIVWDIGLYRPLKDVTQGLQQGRVEIWLEGHKLKGGYALIRTGQENWLLVKMKDDEADPSRDPTVSEPQSALSGKTLEQVRDDHQPT